MRLLMLMLAACQPGPEVIADEPVGDTPEVEPLPDYEPLGPVALLVRASLDLRGGRPTIEELTAVESDPDSVYDLIEGFVDQPPFPSRLVQMFANIYQTRSEQPFAVLTYYLRDWSLSRLSRSIGFEPLEMLAEVARADLPYTELVLADWTMANEVTSEIWPIEGYPTGEFGWRRARYTDGRPAVGVLASNGMWWHYGSMENNLNRGRANAVSRIFLCADYLDIEIDFGTDQPLSSEAALGNAIRTDPACASCHDTLDPLAAHFYGYWWFGSRKGLPQDIENYHPERERSWQDLGGLPPGYFGQPTAGLPDLGDMIANDPRYARCFVEQSWELLLHRKPLKAERQLLDAHEATFRSSDLHIKALYRDLVRSAAYTDGSGEDGRRMMDPAMMSSAIHKLTGYRLEEDSFDLTTAPLTGFMPLAGGIDGIFRSAALTEPAATMLLVHQRLAEAAGLFVATNDRANPPQAHLFTRIDWTETPDTNPSAMVEQLQRLHALILSERVAEDSVAIDEELQLWSDMYELTGSPEASWGSLVTLLIRDPRFLVY